MREFVTMSHGSGGTATQEIIRSVFAPVFGMTDPLTDSALIDTGGIRLAFTTDSYVVNPVFFPGGNIGKLAVCGTINDLAVSGAVPMYLSASFIIEEGFPMEDLKTIAVSMAGEALNAGVRIVTGDTKVVEKGKCDMIFITTSGTGLLKTEREHISTGGKIRTGDKLIVNGHLGNHAVAVLGARNNLNFSSGVTSDCASLNHMIGDLLEKCTEIRFMRDLTRGGLAGVLNELAQMVNTGILVNESTVPVDEPVKGLCEILGFDPLNLANEGKVIIVISEEEHVKALNILRSHPLGKNAAVIGEIVQDRPGSVILSTLTGGKRLLHPPSGILLPRIC
jgi:hydrogenase expression/formation protein HypE